MVEEDRDELINDIVQYFDAQEIKEIKRCGFIPLARLENKKW
jgi:hypothetical protein